MPAHRRGGFTIAVALLVWLLAACAPAAEVQTVTPAAEPPTPVPTFTPTPATPSPTPTATPRPTDTPAPATATATSTSTPAATATSVPVSATATRRPPTATPAPTATTKPSVDFKVLEQRLLGAKENGGTTTDGSIQSCGFLHIYLIKAVDINNVPLPNILVRRVYAGNAQIPPTGNKGPGMTEEVTPTHAGDIFYVMGDTGGTKFTSEQTRTLSVRDTEIPNADLIAGGYCRDKAECDYRKSMNLLCEGHYSYNIVFQRQW